MFLLVKDFLLKYFYSIAKLFHNLQMKTVVLKLIKNLNFNRTKLIKKENIYIKAKPELTFVG